MFDHIKAKDDVSKVKDLALFDELILAQLKISARADELRRVAQYRLVDGRMRSSDRTQLRRMGRDVTELALATRAMQFGGRDLTNLQVEILRCFKKNGHHSAETIARRFFGVKGHRNPGYEAESWIEHLLEQLRKKGLVDYSYGTRSGGKQWFVLTPEIKEQRAADRKRRAARKAAAEELAGRKRVVLYALKCLGIEGEKTKGGIELSIEQAEALVVKLTVEMVEA
jgi:hypothetical protein